MATRKVIVDPPVVNPGDALSARLFNRFGDAIRANQKVTPPTQNKKAGSTGSAGGDENDPSDATLTPIASATEVIVENVLDSLGAPTGDTIEISRYTYIVYEIPPGTIATDSPRVFWRLDFPPYVSPP